MQQALKSFFPVVCVKVIQVAPNNVATVYDINVQGGTGSKKPCCHALELWQWCILHHIFLQAVRVPGVENVAVDCLSHTTSSETDRALKISYVI